MHHGERALIVLLWMLIIFVGGWIIHWTVLTFFPDRIKKTSLLYVGIIIIVLVVILLIRVPGLYP